MQHIAYPQWGCSNGITGADSANVTDELKGRGPRAQPQRGGS